MKQFYIYILASKKYGTLYIGMTSNLEQRIWQHKNKVIDGFTKKYNVNKLVYFEVHNNFESAVSREKNMKAWKRQWKINLIEKENLHWNDLYEGLLE